MKIGIISDTHVTKKVENIDKLLKDYFYDVDTIIHVGDFNSLEVIKRIKTKKVYRSPWK
ncbi:phosphoesterase [Clostridium tetani 12124569]|nr:phosphoesterase [Clostridium tetani 12124569]